MNESIQHIPYDARLSEATIFNGVVYLAGQVPDQAVDGDIGAQTREVLGMVDALLRKAGSDRAHLLRCQIYLKDIGDIAGMNAVWDQWVAPGRPPARATVQAALGDPRWRIEIVATAAVAA